MARRESTPLYKLTVLGDGGVGKTALTIQRVKEDDDPFSVVIVGNKSDRGPDEREVSTQEGEALADELGGVPIFESSAKLNINIEAAFFECARQCKKLRANAALDQHAQQLQQQQQQQQQQLPFQASQASQQINQSSQDNNSSSLAYHDQYASNQAAQQHVPQPTQQQQNHQLQQISPQQQVKSTASNAHSTQSGKPPKKKNKKDKCAIM